MTPCSAACGGRFSRRSSSRSTWRRTSSGSPMLGEALAQLVGLRGALVEVAQLLLDGLELLAQDELALVAVELGLDLLLDAGPDRDDLELARERLREAPEARRDVGLLEERLLLLGRDAQRRGDEVAERGGVVDVGDGDLQLLGQVRDLLDDRGERRLHVAHERGELGRRCVVELGDLLDLGREVGLLLRPAHDADAAAALHEQAQRAVGHAQHARDDADDADVVEVVRAGRLEVGLARRDHHQRAVAREDVVDEADRALLADGERGQRVGERDRLAQRQDGRDGGHRGPGVDRRR